MKPWLSALPANGLDMNAILDVVNVSSGRNTATMDKFPNRISNEAFDGFATKMMAKDVRLYVENVTRSKTASKIAPRELLNFFL